AGALRLPRLSLVADARPLPRFFRPHRSQSTPMARGHFPWRCSDAPCAPALLGASASLPRALESLPRRAGAHRTRNRAGCLRGRWRPSSRPWHAAAGLCYRGPNGTPGTDPAPRSEERRVGRDWSSDVCSSDLARMPHVPRLFWGHLLLYRERWNLFPDELEPIVHGTALDAFAAVGALRRARGMPRRGFVTVDRMERQAPIPR